MNSNITLGGGGLSLGVVAAGLILGYGVWVRRDDLGLRAALGTLGATLLATLLAAVPFLLSFYSSGVSSPFRSVLGWLLMGVLGTAAAFFPLYVAANWLRVIRQSVQSGGEIPATGR